MKAVYRRLAEEGILSSVRASRTILQGRDAIRTLKVRALIGMPLSVPQLRTHRAYRECYMRMRDELHARGFVVSPLYFEESEIEPDRVAQRARAEKLDAVIWIRREGIGHDTALRLRDAGIRFVGVNIGGVVGGFCRYEVRRRQAIGTILHEWRTAGNLRTAVVVRAGKEGIGEKERIERLRAIAAQEGVELEVENVPEGRISRTLEALCSTKTKCGGLLTAPAAAILGSRAPDTITDVLACCRIALIDGPMDFPFLEKPLDAAVDLVWVDWRRVARRIAQDALSGDAFKQSETIAFEAGAHLQISLGGIAAEPRSPRGLN